MKPGPETTHVHIARAEVQVERRLDGRLIIKAEGAKESATIVVTAAQEKAFKQAVSET